jgi:hypothetical protein
MLYARSFIYYLSIALTYISQKTEAEAEAQKQPRLRGGAAASGTFVFWVVFDLHGAA